MGGGGSTYFFPMQFRGPAEKGCNTLRTSSAYLGSPSQRSGTNLAGSRKLLSLW
jgi:hypothetical protein